MLPCPSYCSVSLPLPSQGEAFLIAKDKAEHPFISLFGFFFNYKFDFASFSFRSASLLCVLVVYGAEVTDDVKSNTTATRSSTTTRFSLYLMMLHGLVNDGEDLFQ